MEKLIEYITKLSINDKKNLSQKLCKVVEESGELSKAILSYENASGFKDKISSKEKILEECCDVILSAISIPLSNGFSIEDISNIITEKTTFWEQKQIKEDKATYPLWYEIHVTINRPLDIDKYVNDCKEIGVKPIVLDLQNGGKNIMKDVMTSSKHLGDNTSSIKEMKRISDELVKRGYDVIREKIESVPWHPKAPRIFDNEIIMPKDCYFESHIGIKITNQNKKKDLETMCLNNEWHLSKNYFKKNDDNSYTIMLTLRDYKSCYERFEKYVDSVKEELVNKGFEYEKVVIEFALYDSKISHDYEWLKNG